MSPNYFYLYFDGVTETTLSLYHLIRWVKINSQYQVQSVPLFLAFPLKNVFLDSFYYHNELHEYLSDPTPVYCGTTAVITILIPIMPHLLLTNTIVPAIIIAVLLHHLPQELFRRAP